MKRLTIVTLGVLFVLSCLCIADFNVPASASTRIVAREPAGYGAVVANKCTAAEYGDGYFHQTVLTLTLTGATDDLDLADGAHGTGIKVYDFPAGRILILGVTMNGTVTNTANFNASTADTFSVSCGSVVGADDDALSSTEVDLIPSTTIDTASAGTLSQAWTAALASSAQFDGTSAALDLYVNAAIAAANNTGANKIGISGTLKITWVQLGDY